MAREEFTLTFEEAQLLRYRDSNGFKVVSHRHVDSGRWVQYYEVVFEKDGRFWSWTYAEGSTENQEGDDLRDEDFRVATEVFAREKTVVMYE